MDLGTDRPFTPEERARLEISLGAALELQQLGLGTLIDIRQGFELDLKGRIPDTVHIPMFEMKRLLGDKLSSNEQEVLDASKPADMDVRGFFKMINQIAHAHDHLLLITCNSGRRSLYVADLMRTLGYPKALSVAGGFQAWKKLQAAQSAQAAQQ